MEKSQFLCLAYQAHVGGTADHDHLDVVEAEAKCLRRELETSLRSREEMACREAQAQS